MTLHPPFLWPLATTILPFCLCGFANILLVNPFSVWISPSVLWCLEWRTWVVLTVSAQRAVVISCSVRFLTAWWTIDWMAEMIRSRSLQNEAAQTGCWIIHFNTECISLCSSYGIKKEKSPFFFYQERQSEQLIRIRFSEEMIHAK